jgi:hypothetical protein
MNSYFSAPIWDKKLCRDTCKIAIPKEAKSVAKARVIVVKHATYRDAPFGGVFLLANSVKLPLPKKGWHAVEVYCCWFGHRLKTRGIKITVDMSDAVIDESYTGKVIANIAK